VISPSSAIDDRLRRFHRPRLFRFACVGGSGFIVNTAALAFSVSALGLHYLSGAVIATAASTYSNFVLTERWVFADRPQGSNVARRFVVFLLLSLATLVIRGPLLVLLTEVASLHFLISNALSLLALMIVRYRFSGTFIWPEVST
jgi:putative flippase GtrA